MRVSGPLPCDAVGLQPRWLMWVFQRRPEAIASASISGGDDKARGLGRNGAEETARGGAARQ